MLNKDIKTLQTLHKQKSPLTFSLSLAALGIVYGDIGTSPLYAMRESLDKLPINLTNILGVLSLIFWSLILIISIKYLVILFRADNDGEGGILALLALLKQFLGDKARIILLIGIFGAGLMLGDGMLTPAISVLSAIEGLTVIAPSFTNWIIPMTVVILISLFSIQSYGTSKIGIIFGPIILIWFITLAILGASQIIQNPIVLKAISPWYAIEFFRTNGWNGYIHLGGIFLVVTGGEALYADMGHLGKKPIRLSWFLVALPALLLNYFGQGANLLNNPAAILNPFYLSAPVWFLFPLLIIATLATIIASQAVISATFSLTKQAILLGLYPHLSIKQTSDVKGQIYVPQMNFILAIGTLLLIITFKNSKSLTHAYGIAVNLDMILTVLLIAYLAIKKWQWNPIIIIVMFSFFAIIDIAFLGANILKVETGGWVPVAFASVCAFIMYTWQKGMYHLRETYYMKKVELTKILKQFDYQSLQRLPGMTAIFITDVYDKSGGSFLHFLAINRILPEHILIVDYRVENVPYISSDQRYNLRILKANVCELTLHYGFMDTVSIPEALSLANDKKVLPFTLDIKRATYLLEIPNVIASTQKETLAFFWQEKIFAFLVRNYSTNINIEFYQLPYNRTIALGTYYII
ncbi:MAG: KUP/HAK/KT family potassium transporter [Tatlockia sp.]|nr:KUP/HAK/KT family potassium transporter [Tatlockia sp.]